MADYKILTIPFARDAVPDMVNDIPNDPSIVEPQLASFKQGFPSITTIPLVAGGIPPEGQDFNGILRDITQHIVHQNKGGMYKFAPEVVAAGGYAKGAVLASNDDLSLWVSLQNNNVQNFNSGTPTQWARIAFSGLDAALNNKLNTSAVVQTLGQSTASVMSQKIVSDEFAARTPTASPTDTTAGRLLKVGDFGVGLGMIIPNNTDLNDILQAGNYRVETFSAFNTLLNKPPISSQVCSLTVFGMQTSSRVQIIRLVPSNKHYERFRDVSGNWSIWQEIYHTGNLPIVQTTGPSATSIMSQKAVTDALAGADKFNGPIATIASASTVDLTAGAPNTSQIVIGGGTTINGFTVAAGRAFVVKFTGACTLVNSGALVTNSGADIVTAAGDSCIMRAIGANTVEVLVYSRMVREYESPPQVITSGGALNLAHGLGVKPREYTGYIVCTTAEAGYSVGDEIQLGNAYIWGGASAGNSGVSIVPGATNLEVRFSAISNVNWTVRKDTGAAVALVNANWRLIVRAKP